MEQAGIESIESRDADPSTVAGRETAAAPTELAFWRAYLTTMRPYLFPISALAGLSGMALANVSEPWRWVLALVAFCTSYGFGQALTDCFQRDTDRLSAPYRPLVRGTISARHALVVSLLGLAVGMAILTWCNPWNLAVSACAVAGLLVYTPLKRRWWAGPLANAWIVALLPIMGWLAGGGNHPGMLARRPDVLMAAAVSFAAYANFVIVGYLKDIAADRQTRYNTLPVVFGWRRTAFISHAWAAAALVAAVAAVSLLAAGMRWPIFLSGLIVLMAAGLSLTAQITLHRISREDQAYEPILNVVRVFLLLHIAVVFAASPKWSPLATFFYFAFEFLAALRPERSQI